MNSAVQVDQLVDHWKAIGLTKEQIIIRCAEEELGWPYVWGAVGAQCTPEKRQYYANRSSCPEAEAKLIVSRCQALNGKTCVGCTFYPNNARVLIDDCQGFVKQVMSRVGISFSGGGCTSMWNTAGNWVQKGPISEMPQGQICCVFMQSGSTMSHIGIHVGQGQVIHCSGTVKRGRTTDRGWTHYAVPKGLSTGGDTPMPWRPTIRKGSAGDDVKYVQEILISLGYNLGSYGADGKFGTKTLEAVKAFQRANGLNPDGVVGPMTYEALEKAIPVAGGKYTVTIRNLSREESEKLKQTYPGCEIKEE